MNLTDDSPLHVSFLIPGLAPLSPRPHPSAGGRHAVTAEPSRRRRERRRGVCSVDLSLACWTTIVVCGGGRERDGGLGLARGGEGQEWLPLGAGREGREGGGAGREGRD